MEKYTKLFQNALKKEPRNIDIWHRMGDLYLKDRQLKAAEICFKTALSYIKKDKKLKYNSKCKLFVIYSKLALAYIFSLQYPNNVQNHEAYAADCLKLFTKAFKLNNESPVLLLLYGKLCFLLQDIPRSTFAFQRAIALDASQPLSRLSLYKLHYQAENWEAAESDLWGERDIQPTSSFVYYSLAVFAFESNVPEAALLFIQKALFLEPNERFYWEVLSNIQKALKPAASSRGGKSKPAAPPAQQEHCEKQNSGIRTKTSNKKKSKK
jgi:tetratricopeptide (TPR) repeat protein